MAKVEVDDDFESLKIRARHRLIGTVFIALVLVSVIPMLLNHPRALEKPSPVAEAPVKPETAPAPEIKMAEVTVAPVSNKDPAPLTPLAPVPTVIPPIDTHSGSGPKSASSETLDKAEPLAEDHASRSDSKKAERETHSGDDVKPAKTPSNERGWFVQIGVFSEEARAMDLKTRLKEKGIDATADAIKGRHGPMTRLRLGPFQDRSAASGLLARVKDLGENAILVHQ